MGPLSQIQNPAIQGLAQGNDASVAKSGGEEGFGDMLMDVMKEVNQTQQNAGNVQTDFMTGRHNVDYQDLMIAMEKASIALQLTASVRDKVLEAYQTISSMQV